MATTAADVKPVAAGAPQQRPLPTILHRLGVRPLAASRLPALFHREAASGLMRAIRLGCALSLEQALYLARLHVHVDLAVCRIRRGAG